MVLAPHSLSLLFIAYIAISDACLRMRVPTPGIPACGKTCTEKMITVATGDTTQPFIEDKEETTSGCLRRKFTCKGYAAEITSEGPGRSDVIKDEGAGIVMYTVTCNTAGTGWEKNGCLTCEETVPLPENTGPKEMTSMVNKDSGCAVAMFRCSGSTNAAIKLFKDDSGTPFFTETESTFVPESAFADLTCNADGTGWTYDGTIVTSLDCTI